MRADKWPLLRAWPVDQLLRLRAAWQEICPQTGEEHASHQVSMDELARLLTEKIRELPGQQGLS